MLIDANIIWLICLALATPIAGVVGFAIQLRTVKKIRLENEKLTLEILTLRKEQEESERRIVSASTEEVIKYNDVLFSRRGPDDYDERSSNSPIVDFAIKTAFMILFVVIIFYLIFDIYRLGQWLYSLAY